jgi:hypothetical protein
VFRLSVVAALVAATAPAARAAPSAPHDLARGMDHVLGRRGPPDLRVVAAGVECLGYLSGAGEDEPLLWYVVPRRGEPGSARVVRGITKQGIAELEHACGVYAGRLARVARATCVDPAELVGLLGSPEVLALRAPDGAGATPTRPDPVEALGCARVVTSRDGRARVWTPLAERWAGPDDRDRDGTGVRRGLAFLQVKDEDGKVRVHVDRSRGEDLHLDATVEAIEPAPERGRFLVLGLRSYDAHAPGALPRRFAFVVETDRAGAVRIARGRFEVGGVRRDLLLLQGPPPASGQFRFHAFSARRLEWSRDDASLRLAPCGDVRIDADARRRPAIAIWTGSAFRVLGRTWDGMIERPGDARVVLAERWGAAEELGARGLDEIVARRAPGSPPPTATERARALAEGRPLGSGALAAASEVDR